MTTYCKNCGYESHCELPLYSGQMTYRPEGTPLMTNPIIKICENCNCEKCKTDKEKITHGH